MDPHERQPDTGATQDAELPLPLRRKFAGRYRIEERLGAGGFGDVFRAHDEMLSRIVSIKVVSLERRGGIGGETDPDAALKEARTVAKLDHPNIVPVYDVGIEGNTVWMAMKLVDGEDCSAILNKAGHVAPAIALRWLRQVCATLDYAHSKGVVHKDIKPSNIIIEKHGEAPDQVWLVDFGIAKILTGNTADFEGSFAGTPHYMSPEQITGKRVDARSDLFSLGAVAYELVTGKRAHPGASYAEVTYSVVHKLPENLGELADLAGKPFAAMVARALAKAPEDRFPSASEMLKELDAVERGEQERHGKLSATLLKPFRKPETGVWDGRDVLVVRRLSKSYKRSKKAVDDVTLSLATGSICAVLGRNGSGKTTFIRTVLGLYRPDSGSISIFGRDPFRERAAILSRVGYVSETFTAYDSMSVAQYIGFLRSFYPKWDNAYCYRLLGSYSLPLDAKIRDLSKGMQTKVSLVGALSHRPDFLVLDDPTLGLDAASSREVFETLKEACQQENATVLMSSHHLDEVETIATHIAFLEDGKLRVSSTLAELRARTREVTMTFRGPAPDVRGIEDFKLLKASETRLTGLLLDTTPRALHRLEELGAEQVEVKELNLKEIFVDFLRDSTPGGR